MFYNTLCGARCSWADTADVLVLGLAGSLASKGTHAGVHRDLKTIGRQFVGMVLR